MLERIAHYRILRQIGEGGMGTVFAAHDERLDRPVALKVIRDDAHTPAARQRFRQEARSAARVSHPNICPLYEIGERDDALFIVMELLEGESLAERLIRGPLPVADSVRIGLDMLAALDALHASGIVHRDLKPSNVYLATHAIKLLDFGLAKMIVEPSGEADTVAPLTRSGVILGTPRYMSPEQARGLPVDARSDVFSAGAVLFEMLSGTPAFAGATFVDVLHAIIYDEPGDGAGRIPSRMLPIVQRALAKAPDDRYRSAAAMAAAIRTTAGAPAHEASAADPRKSWLIVLPFRALQSDPDAQFLAFGLGDAITSSLSSLQSLGVRSSAAAARFAADSVDFTRVAAEAHADLALTGTLLRAGQQIRAIVQLVEVPAGALLWSHTAQVTLHDVFQVQDEIVQRIVGALALPLTAREHRLLKHDVPANPTAYEFYLRASQLSQGVGLESVQQFRVARDLFVRSVEEDPLYAPAWARLGRACRVIGKGGDDADGNLARAEAALQRALQLNPELPVAHYLYAQLETDLGRSADALLRLTGQASHGGGDAQVFAGLVQACRYCGLFEASVAAHARARALDPQIATSVRHTRWMLRDTAGALKDGGTFYFESMVLASEGRDAEAIRQLRAAESADRPEMMRVFLSSLRLLLEGDRDASLDATERCLAHFRDPESWFYMVRQLAVLGATERALTELDRVVDYGYLCGRVLDWDPWLDALRSLPRCVAIRERSRAREHEIAAQFVQAGGARLVGLH